jgi:RimJ/RimL family protein N-acetyltransferase
MSICTISEFLQKHEAAILANDTKYNLACGILQTARESPEKAIFWSLGAGESFALQTPPNFVVLGELNEAQAQELFLELRGRDFRGCLGPTDSAQKFKKVLESFGVPMEVNMEQRIYELTEQPRRKEVDGFGREFRPEDLGLFHKWFTNFVRESLPGQAEPTIEEVLEISEKRKIFFWNNGLRLVAMAARTRETPMGSNISYVYTPREERGRGYAQAITAFASEHAFRAGKKKVFLYTDLANPISNHLYEKLGFRFAFSSTSYQKVSKK